MWDQGQGEVSAAWLAGRWVTVTQPLRSDHRSVPFHLHGPAAGHTASTHDLSPSTPLRICCQCFELQCNNFIISISAVLLYYLFYLLLLYHWYIEVTLQKKNHSASFVPQNKLLSLNIWLFFSHPNETPGHAFHAGPLSPSFSSSSSSSSSLFIFSVFFLSSSSSSSRCLLLRLLLCFLPLFSSFYSDTIKNVVFFNEHMLPVFQS